MKKTWTNPGIEQEVLSATAFNEKQGEVQDGEYLNWEDCKLYPLFSS